MGHPWNRKQCKCKICGEEQDSISEGKAHVHVYHDIKYKKTREQLEEL